MWNSTRFHHQDIIDLLFLFISSAPQFHSVSPPHHKHSVTKHPLKYIHRLPTLTLYYSNITLNTLQISHDPCQRFFFLFFCEYLYHSASVVTQSPNFPFAFCSLHPQRLSSAIITRKTPLSVSFFFLYFSVSFNLQLIANFFFSPFYALLYNR